jgi:N-acylethanolamine-hydrolysing acid amidase
MLALLTLLAVCLASIAIARPINVTVQTYIIDTSLPASEYLKEICEEQKANALRAFPVMLDMIPPAMQGPAGKLAMEYWNSGTVAEPYHSEIEYLSECSGLTIQQLITVNIVYDLTAFCTSIVAVKKDGTILHARNQDFPTVLRNDTVNMIYVDGNNNTLYESTTFFGYVGIPTGVRYNGFSITIDARYGIDGLKDWLEIHRNFFPSGWLVRECLMYDTTFDACIHRLSTAEIQAPIYFIVAGTDGSMDGAIVTRNQTVVNGPDRNADNPPLYLTNSNHGWYLVETNYDYWKPAMDNRREHAIKMMDEVGQANISYATLYSILSTPPVLASSTVYTTLMSPSDTTYYNSTVRFNTRPDDDEEEISI